MDKVEPSNLNPLSTISSVDDVKGNENSPNKRKWGCVYRRYYAMRKKIKDTLFSSPGVGFSEKCNNHSHSSHGDKFQDDSTLDDEDQVGNAMNGSCLAKKLGFEKTNFQIKRQDFPETKGRIATTAVFDRSADAFHAEGCHTTIENLDIKRSMGEDELCKQTETVQPSLKKMRLFDPSIKPKDETHMHKCDSGRCMSNEELGPSRTAPIGKILKASEFQAQPMLTYDSINGNNHVLCSEFGGKHHFNLPASDGSAESMVVEETSAPAEDGDTRRHNSSGVEASQSVSFFGDEPDETDYIYSSAVREREYENLPDSPLNISNKHSLYVNVVSISAMDDIPISQLLDSPEYILEDSTIHVDQQGVCHWQADVSSSHPDSPELSEGNIICSFNTEDPEIPQLSEGDLSCRLNIEDTGIPQLSEGGISCRLNAEDTEIPQLSEGDISCRLHIEDTKIAQLSEGGISCRSNIEDAEIPQLSEGDISCRLNIEDTEIPQFGEWGIGLKIEDTEVHQLSEGAVSCRSIIEDTEIPQLGEWGVICRLDIEDTKIPEFSKGGISFRLNIEDTEIHQLGEWGIRLNVEDTEIPQLSEEGVSCRSNIEDTEIPQLGKWDISCRLNIEDTKIPQLGEGGVNCRSNIEDTELPQFSEGICRLNLEDPEIPCNDEIFLLIRPSVSFDLSITSIATDSIDPSSSSEDEIDDEQESSASKVPALSFTQSQMVSIDSCSECHFTHPLIGHILKSESSDTKCVDPLSGQCDEIRDPGQPQYMLTNSVLIEDRGLTEDELDDSETDSEGSLQTEVGTLKMIDPESMDDSSISDHNSADSDGDLPCFSHTEALTKIGSPKMIDPESMDYFSISDHNSAASDGDLPCFSDTEALTKVGSPKMIDPESLGDFSISDHNSAASDGDLPCFSDTEALTKVGSRKMIDPESMGDSSISDRYSADSDGDLPCISDAEALTKVGSPKMIDPESMDDSSISDHNNTDSDGDLPCFSDIEALIHGIGLEYSQDSCITSAVARHHYNYSNRTITRPQQAARYSLQRAMSSLGALAIFYSRQFDYYIKKTEVTIGRSTDDTDVDIDLRKEGCASMISRRQATIKMDVDGTFTLANIGKSSISMNGNSVAPGQVAALCSSSLIEIKGIKFMFEINDRYVRQYVNNIIKKIHGTTTTFEWSPEGEPRR